MTSSVIDSILDMITPEFTQTLAANLGASGQALQSGVDVAITVILATLARRAADPGFLAQVIGVASSAPSHNILGSVSSLTSGGTSGAASDLVSRFLPLVLGSQQNQVANAITQQTGVGAGSAAAVLKVAALLVLGYLGRLQSAGSLDVFSLASALKSDAPKLATPGADDPLVSETSGLSHSDSAPRLDVPRDAAPTRVLRWSIPVATIGLLLLAFAVLRSPGGPGTQAITGSDIAAGPALGQRIKLKLPDGRVLSVPVRGVELRLASYLGRGAAVHDRQDTWFDFDRLQFDRGGATLEPASAEQLNDVAAILKAYPNAQVQLGAYTDNTGDPQVNLKLSEERAENVLAELVNAGIDASRLSAKGYGADHPIADNSTEAGREKNRRISIRVAEK